MEPNLSFRDRKRVSEKLFTKKEVNEMLQDKQRQLDVQYSVLKEVYAKYDLLKKENEELKKSFWSMKHPVMVTEKTGHGWQRLSSPSNKPVKRFVLRKLLSF